MNVKKLNAVLKPYGLEAEKTKDGEVRLTEQALEALSDCGEQHEKPTHYYVIQARHEVDITYKVPGTSFEDALDKLCNVELFTEHSSNLFGPDEYMLSEVGAEVVETDTYGDPGATGSSWTQRDWEYHVEDEDGNEREDGE